MKRVDFTGNFKGLNGKELEIIFYEKQEDGNVVKIERKIDPIYEYLGNALDSLNSKTLEDKLRNSEFAKQIFTKKYIDLNKADEKFLIDKLIELNLQDRLFCQIHERIEKGKPKKEE